MLSSLSALPDDLYAIVRALDAIDRDAQDLVGPLNDEQFNWQPAGSIGGGRAWSIGQCFDHLKITNAGYVPAIVAAADRARRAGSARRGQVRLGFIGRRVVHSMEPPPRFRMRGPGTMAPASATRKAEVWPAFLALNEHVRAALTEYKDIDLNRASMANPFVRGLRLKLTTAVLLIVAHNRRHVWQARRVREAPEFPPPAATD